MKQALDKALEDKNREIEKLKEDRNNEMDLLRRQLNDVIADKSRAQEQSQKDITRLTDEIGRYPVLLS